MKYEYRIFNLSEVADYTSKHGHGNMLTVLNKHGLEGWQVLFKINEQSFLMMRAVS